MVYLAGERTFWQLPDCILFSARYLILAVTGNTVGVRRKENERYGEFSRELHTVAQRNIASYKGTRQKCRDITSLCMDFTEFEFPDEPLFLFLYNPASKDLTRVLARNLLRSLEKRERKIWILYVTPQDVFDSEQMLQKVKTGECSGHPYCLYTNAKTGWMVAA